MSALETGEPSAAVGLIGCGKISQAYLDATYPGVRYVACADLDEARARATAARYNLQAMDVDELLTNSQITVVCNLTVPRAHAYVSLAAVEAGKHVYVEKPLGIGRNETRALLEAADKRGVLVGCAPDTFLGAGLQTCRQLIDAGFIGTPVASFAHMVSHGHEHWHPDPQFYYERGGGPLFDMGPYYLTALVSLLGPVVSVSAMSGKPTGDRIIRSGPRVGETISVTVPTHVAGTLAFAGGTVSTLVMSFDVWSSELPRLEIHGTEGSLSLPDPNTFGAPVRLYRAETGVWETISIEKFDLHTRGVGLADMSRSISTGEKHRASGALAYHVLDVMLGLEESAEGSCVVNIESSIERPQAMPAKAAPSPQI